MASYNGMGYENNELLESLAQKGFIVISISSIGRYPGDMTMKNEDMTEQVNDALAALKALHKDSNMDFSNVSIIGYSWGGVSGAVLAGKIPHLRCLISLDGSEFHHYNDDKNEDADFDGIKNSAFKKMRLTAPYLRLENTTAAADKKDSVYNFAQNLSKNMLILKVRGTGHEDFFSIPIIVKASGGCDTGDLYQSISALTISYLEDHTKNKSSFKPTLAGLDAKIMVVK